MKARVAEPAVSATAGGRGLSVRLQLENNSDKTWSSETGHFLGYQVFDAETDTLILDGPRKKFQKPIQPGETADIELDVRIPEGAGRFRIFLSPLEEEVAWFFERGSPFLLIEADATDSEVEVKRCTVVTMASLRLVRSLRFLARAFFYPVSVFLRHGSLIRTMVRRDILGRYRGSYAGLFWTVIHPLTMMLTYYFVFGIVLQTRFGDDARPSNFVLYFLAGMMPWLAFSEAVGRAPTTVIEHGNFVKKLVFPIEILPVTLVVAGLVSEAFGVSIFLAGMAFFGHTPTASVFYLPILLIPQFLLTLGLSWLLAALGVFFRDLGQLIGFFLTVWFFTTPICYPEASLPQNYLWLFELNPLYVLVKSYRAIFLEASPPPWTPLAYLTLLAALIFVIGHGWFYKLKRSFADAL